VLRALQLLHWLPVHWIPLLPIRIHSNRCAVAVLPEGHLLRTQLTLLQLPFWQLLPLQQLPRLRPHCQRESTAPRLSPQGQSRPAGLSAEVSSMMRRSIQASRELL
jgi:hypothetical protein